MAFWDIMVYVSIYFCLFLTVQKALTSSASPRGGNMQFQKMNHFPISTGGSAHADGSGPWPYILPVPPVFLGVCSAVRCCSTQEVGASSIFVLCTASLSPWTDLHTQLPDLLHSLLYFFPQFILSHPAAINRTKSSRWLFLQD